MVFAVLDSMKNSCQHRSGRWQPTGPNQQRPPKCLPATDNIFSQSTQAEGPESKATLALQQGKLPRKPSIRSAGFSAYQLRFRLACATLCVGYDQRHPLFRDCGLPGSFGVSLLLFTALVRRGQLKNQLVFFFLPLRPL